MKRRFTDKQLSTMLKDKRNAQSLTQKQMAFEVGMSYATYQKAESSRPLSPGSRFKVILYLGIMKDMEI